MWSEALESMIQGVDNEREYAHKRLPDWAWDAIGVPEVGRAGFSSCNSWSNCSLLNEGVSGTCALAGKRLESPCLLVFHSTGFQSVGFPCNFQQVSRVWHDLLQWSHQTLGLSSKRRWLLGLREAVATVPNKAEFSTGSESFFSSITFLQLSSRCTSKNTSPTEGRGCRPKILPQTQH